MKQLGWLVFGITTTVASAQSVEIEVNGTPAPGDDFLCWSPMQGRIRAVGSSADLDFVLSSETRQSGQMTGEVWFAPYSDSRPTSAQFSPNDTLSITLPQSGVWKSFWVAGKRASTDGKDTAIIATGSDGNQLARIPIMVRVRKNARMLQPIEVNRFLTAVATLHDLDNNGIGSKYLKYVKTHAEAFFLGIHNVPAFPPWHRTMILSFERELQQIDPRVALPYWKFDENAPELFDMDFLGVVSGGASLVEFSRFNPLDGWKMPTNSVISKWAQGSAIPESTESLKRGANAGTDHPGVSFAAVMRRPNYSLMWRTLETRYHNDAHGHILGWLGSIQSPKDPLFFLLHANVDRAWARWQKDKGMFAETDPLAYSPQGSYPGAQAMFHQGSYADDTQWPWDLRGGNQGTQDPNDDWPLFVFELPIAPPHHGPSIVPSSRESIDFQDSRGDGFPHNYSYDTISFID